ncbi:hypothetical protein D8674_003341 [Pyrus ussuriensis x Pyrus communis]|uniref:RING-type domain-containing protein n=1 Tax=Pyrus ussuriensis x Pyrus communis TaxID=2448454 RepID=A0A5N5FGU3_9ROSA|nr:hypothetical protein D8674_003341 [Pyrus ussuriensis x Pyrus communis]
MGLGSDEEVVVEESDGVGGGGGCGGKSYGGSVSCSICLEVVADNVDRSWAKLQCGHEFHLVNGCRSFPELNMEDWTHDEDVYNLSYSEMGLGALEDAHPDFFTPSGDGDPGIPTGAGPSIFSVFGNFLLLFGC